MSLSREKVADYVALIDFLRDNVESDNARPLARRIGVESRAKFPAEPDSAQTWQAIIEAALTDRCIEKLLHEVDKLTGEADRESLKKAKLACAEAQFQTIMRLAHPDLYSVNGQLASARTLGELGGAGKACRELVLRILSAVEVGSAERSLLIAVSNTADLDRLAERIGTLTLNVLTTVDRLIDLTEGHNELDDVHLRPYAAHHPDDFGTFEGAGSPDPQLLTQARNARAAAWAHLQRLIAVLTRNTVFYK